MTKIFGVKREGSKVLTIPTVIQMHCNAEYAERWVNYSTLDTEATYFLYYTFINLLRDIPTDLINPGKPNEYKMRNLLDIY
jgi:DNA polymerase-1